MSEQYYDIPVPKDLTKIRSIHDGKRWLNGVIPNSVSIDHGIITFAIRWNRGETRRFTVATDLLGGYECGE